MDLLQVLAQNRLQIASVGAAGELLIRR